MKSRSVTLCVHVLQGRDEDIAERDDLQPSMKPGRDERQLLSSRTQPPSVEPPPMRPGQDQRGTTGGEDGLRPDPLSAPGSVGEEMGTHVLVSDVLEQLELSVGPLAQHGRRERLHDLLDRDRRVGELILGGAGNRSTGHNRRKEANRGEWYVSLPPDRGSTRERANDAPDETERAHA